MPKVIQRGMRFEPVVCPTCGSGALVVATDPGYRVEPTPRNPRPSVEFIGYDCLACGEELRFE